MGNINPNNIVLTTEEVQSLKSKLEDFRLEVYKTDFEIRSTLNKLFTRSESDFLFGFINENTTAEELSSSIDKVLTFLDEKESLNIKLPFEPSLEFIDWLKDLVKDKFLVSTDSVEIRGLPVLKFVLDPNLIAGAVIEYKGKIKDFSVGKKFLETF